MILGSPWSKTRKSTFYYFLGRTFGAHREASVKLAQATQNHYQNDNTLTDPREHIIVINNQMTIVGASTILKHKHMTRHSSNTIVWGFSRGGETSSARKQYTQTVMHVRQGSLSEGTNHQDTTTFPKKYVEKVIPHEEEPMVIKVKIQNWDVKRVLVDPGSLTDILY